MFSASIAVKRALGTTLCLSGWNASDEYSFEKAVIFILSPLPTFHSFTKSSQFRYGDHIYGWFPRTLTFVPGAGSSGHPNLRP